MPRREVLSEVVADADRVLEEVLEGIALNVRVCVKQREFGEPVDKFLKRRCTCNSQARLKHLATVVVVADQTRKYRVIDIVQHFVFGLGGKRCPAIELFKPPTLAAALPVVLYLTNELQEQQIGELAKPLDALAKSLSSKQVVRLGEDFYQFLFGLLIWRRCVKCRAITRKPHKQFRWQ